MSMNLGQMSNFITGKVGQFDSVALDLCKDYLRARYQMVWDEYFWRDSQLVESVTVTAGTNGFNLPSAMDRLVTIGNQDGTFLDPVDESFLLEAAPDVLTASGTPRYYTEIPETLPTEAPPPGTTFGIRIYPIPDKNTTFLVFGKRRCPGFGQDNAVSMLRNTDNVIVAFAMADMLERLRQYAKAQSKFQEANALLEKAKAVERDQANRPRRNKDLTVVGNSLAEMTDAVCAICGVWTPDYRIIVREFLRRNYVALYQMMLWPESTVVVRVAYGGEQVILPHYVDRVLGARTADGFRLMPNDVNYLFAVSPTIFESTGTPVSMTLLTPVGVGSLPTAPPERLSLASSNAQDDGKRVFIRGESGGTEVIEEVILGRPSGGPPPASPDARAPVLTKYAYDVPLTIAKDITVGDLTVNGASTTQLYQMIPAGERERKHQRIWLLPPAPPDTAATPVPSATSTLDCANGCLVLGKRKIIPLRTDEDTPIITGAQGVLISAAAADLFTRLGNGDSAQVYRSRADISAKVLISENTDQAAYCPKIVPMIEPYALYAGVSDEWSK